MSDAKLGMSYDDKFTSMQIGKLKARVAELEADNSRLRAALQDWKTRIKQAGKRECPTCYSIYCDIGAALREDE